MILKYKKNLKCLVIKGCEHIEKGIIRNEDLMQTDFVPLNFNGSVKNYVLRNGHEMWESMHREAEEKIQKEWLVELGYNPNNFEVDPETHEIKAKDNPHWNPNYYKITGEIKEDKEVESI